MDRATIRLSALSAGAEQQPHPSVLHGATLGWVPTSHPRHSITETPELAAVLAPLRERLGADMPTLAELVRRGAQAQLRELEARDRARAKGLSSFVERLANGPAPDLAEVDRIRRSQRHP